MTQNQIIRLINAGLLIAFSICYLEWGGGNSSFVYEVEYSLFNKNNLMDTLTHPVIMLGIAGQVLLIISIFKKVPDKIVNLIGLLMLGGVVLLVMLTGILSANMKIIGFATPYVVLSILYFVMRRKIKLSPSRKN